MQPVPLRVEKLRRAMRGCIIGQEIHVLEKTTSTNDALWQRMGGETLSGLTVFAETQTAGRGQHGNVWESAPRKGLWFSVILQPKITLAESSALTTWAAGSVCEILREYGLDVRVKAPNDVVADRRKVAGVLVEMRARQNSSHVAILGIGVNINQSPEDFPDAIRDLATSPAIILGRQLDRTELAIALLHRLNKSYRW
ncbi:MAG TPA: biotin--[acetyl-CoA-carboxylase] ligase [Chthoniobacterales bacterium]|jgi:BirA family biotin operon repressor/biotin-[acetyl-CoA-carboxylase] ligase